MLSGQSSAPPTKLDRIGQMMALSTSASPVDVENAEELPNRTSGCRETANNLFVWLSPSRRTGAVWPTEKSSARPTKLDRIGQIMALSTSASPVDVENAQELSNRTSYCRVTANNLFVWLSPSRRTGAVWPIISPTHKT